MKIPHDPNEELAIVNEQNEKIGTALRKDIHPNGLLHREVAVYIIDNNRLLLQFRTDFPKYDHSCAGHFPHDQTYEQAAVREIEEELGLFITEQELKTIGVERLRIITPGKINNVFVKVFLVYADTNNVVIDPGEVDHVKLFSKKELQELLNTPNMITSTAKANIEKYILDLLE